MFDLLQLAAVVPSEFVALSVRSSDGALNSSVTRRRELLGLKGTVLEVLALGSELYENGDDPGLVPRDISPLEVAECLIESALEEDDPVLVFHGRRVWWSGREEKVSQVRSAEVNLIDQNHLASR